MSKADRRHYGRSLRQRIARSDQGEWRPEPGRDPIAILQASDRGRAPELLPIRYGRMLHSPFAFLRGAASVMAFDLGKSGATRLGVQACGDCHLLNFGAFATPERNIIFDIVDFDETLPAPWEWDIKRPAASVMVAARYRGFPHRHCLEAVLYTARTYRTKLADYAALPVLDVWYARIDASEMVELGPALKRAPTASTASAAYAAARLLPKLTELSTGRPRIKDEPPLLYHAAGDYAVQIQAWLRLYRDSLPPERRALLERYRVADIAMKVVGVGSVGTRCAVALLLADDEPLFLQFKEARASVLEPYSAPSAYRNQGERVVVGQRLMQSASDVFLGWARTSEPAFDFYVRQLKDTKLSVVLDALTLSRFTAYAYHCAWALARAHAKTGDAAMISGYLGKSDAFDKALLRFARAYADQTERDHAAFVQAVDNGRIQADVTGERLGSRRRHRR